MDETELQAAIDSKPGKKITVEHLKGCIAGQTFFHHGRLTICVLDLHNGFTVTGESACVDPANYDIEICRRIAWDNAFNKLWQLEGYLLRQQMHNRDRLFGKLTSDEG